MSLLIKLVIALLAVIFSVSTGFTSWNVLQTVELCQRVARIEAKQPDAYPPTTYRQEVDRQIGALNELVNLKIVSLSDKMSNIEELAKENKVMNQRLLDALGQHMLAKP